MQVIIIDGNRHLINTQAIDSVQDYVCDKILKHASKDAVIDWDENVTLDDVLPLTVQQLINKSKLTLTY